MQDEISPDIEQYSKMGLNLDPNYPPINFRNEKNEFFLCHKCYILHFQF